MARAHGTYAKYKEDGCRCEACRMAHGRAKSKRVKQRATGHGTIGEYRRGCRCTECAAAYTTWVDIEMSHHRDRWF